MPLVYECTIDITGYPFKEPDFRYGSVDWAFKYEDLQNVKGKINLRIISPKSFVRLDSSVAYKDKNDGGTFHEWRNWEVLFVSGKSEDGSQAITGFYTGWYKRLTKGYMLLEMPFTPVVTSPTIADQSGAIDYDYEDKPLTPNLYIRIDDILDFLNCDHKFSEPIPWKGGLPIIADWVQDRVGDDDIVVKRLRHLIESKVMV